MNNKEWYHIKSDRIVEEGEFVPAHAIDFLVELVPIVKGCDLMYKKVDNLNQ
jgi:hypothetical protein